MSDTRLNDFVSSGTNAERLAFTPSPPTPAGGADPMYIWKETDTGDFYGWDPTNATWAQINVAGTAASTTEVLTGTNTTKFVSPDALAALWEQGSDIASAATISVGEGGFFHVTGTTGITDIDFATDKTGRGAILVFDGALTITHNAASLILPTGSNITTAAGDCCLVISEGTDNVRVVWYQRKDGTSLAGSTTFCSTTEQLTGTETAKASNPDTVAALWEQGSDIASAATISIGEGGYFHVTGTTTITDIDFGTTKAGRAAKLVFDGALTLTHNATTLILPTGANITTAAGDTCLVVSEGGDNVRVTDYMRKDGTALVGGSTGGTIYPAFTALVAGDYTARNSAGALVTNANGGVYFTAAASATDSWRHYDKAVPGSPYTITLLFIPNFVNAQYLFGGFLWNDGTKLVSFDITSGTLIGEFGLNCRDWTSATSFSADNKLGPFVGAMNGLWLRAGEDASNRIMSFSKDGDNFIPFLTETKTNHLTATKIGFGVNSRNSTWQAAATIYSWAQT